MSGQKRISALIQEVVQTSQISARWTESLDSSHVLIGPEEFVHFLNLKRPLSNFSPQVLACQLTCFIVFFSTALSYRASKLQKTVFFFLWLPR